MAWYRQHPGEDRLTLTLHVQPGAKRTALDGLHGDALKVRVAARAVEGQANGELLAFVAELFGVPKRQVSLVSGERNRHKVVEVRGSGRDPAALLEQG